MDFPTKPALPSAPPPGMFAALGATARMVARSQFDYLLEMESEEMVRALTPDFSALRGIEARGIVVTARAWGPIGASDWARVR